MADHEPLDTEKGPGHSKYRTNWNNLVPKFMTIQVPDVQIDRNALETKLQYKYLIIFILMISIILSSIAIAGCSNNSKGLVNAYLLEYRYEGYKSGPLDGDGVVNDGAYATFNSNVNQTDLRVRIGYFGTCIGSTVLRKSTQDDWICSNNVTTLAKMIKVPTEDPFNGIHLMNELRSNIISPVIFIMSVCISFLSLVTLAAANITSPTLFFVATGLTVFSCFLGLVALVWQQVAVDTARSVLNNLSNNAIDARGGSVPAGLGWTSVLFLFMCTIGIVALVVNENQALIGLQEFGSEFEASQGKYGQDALTGRPFGESNLHIGGAPNYPDNGNVDMPRPY